MKVVCFSEIQWHYVRTRKQQIISRFPDDWEILFLSTIVAGRENNLVPRREGRVTHVCVPVFKSVSNRAIKAIFSIPPVRFLWNLLILLWVKTVLLATGFAGRRRVLYISNIFYAPILRFFPASVKVYDCNDDPLAFPNTPAWAEKYFHSLALSADVVAAVSHGLVGRLRELGVSDIRYIGNGVDYDLFVKAISGGIPEEMKSLSPPVLGYSGAIALWFDMELLDMIASRFPQASIVLLGPLFEQRREELESLCAKRPNIRYIGSKPYEKLGAYIAAMDVCLIPLQMNELMRMADPNKLYEYAAAGRPVVTYRFAEEMDRLGDMIYLAGSREEFLEKIETALEKGADRERLIDFARKSSWQARAGQMTALIEEFTSGEDRRKGNA